MPGSTKEIDILIATDCISEGQNLQDCDYLVNYDIHWNPVRIIQRTNGKLCVYKIHFQVETGIMDTIKSKEELLSGASFVKEETGSYGVTMTANSNVKYDLIGK